MKVSIFGTGYVGLVTGSCLAHSGHQVTCVDVDQEKVARLTAGEIPIYEPGLDSIVKQSVKEGRLHFSTSAEEAVNFAEVIFIAVGTPPDEDGAADLRYVLQVAQSVGEHMQDYRLVINKSTVPVGSADKVKNKIASVLQERGVDYKYDVASNPEFLKEGAAVSDFMKPDRIIVGTESERVKKLMLELYAPFNRNRDKLMFMTVRSAELTKYAANAMLATKISFMNELSRVAEKLGADIELVRKGIGSDPRIGYSFIYPGCGYGGSCFPKDVKALVRTANSIGEPAELLTAVESVNDSQKFVLVEKLKKHFNGDLAGKTIALWGLAFKPNTDDMREAPSRVVMESLWEMGAKVQAYDPEAMKETGRIYGERDDLVFCENEYTALENADALVVCTEWSAFRSPDWDTAAQKLKSKVVFDGRNLYEPDLMADRGYVHYAIGRQQTN
ncbi:UDP-glucose/GDP-mannose dehydrogenase family protein [Teredinibacter sp. KSP-S5-2]|uniref:UDP-glucose dehydrogenase family protein n=1 Tax=Teredinibacter sp. KSP-S5-2 TaxID=3034506 RepID=UPI002934B56C|nr:UDP-glucose/GDP-mannose dehydrogenase family protein [Teredinibacter sp. KSP-S5-2]WNO07837.1 UDP-glucose/GDP-mannose dehydrogenase family protein [Teredinibacter sp. KSP-S5-2]